MDPSAERILLAEIIGARKLFQKQINVFEIFELG
jgi:hypothetical protein